jgi:aspartate/methionine/tyrosine aminotransferase
MTGWRLGWIVAPESLGLTLEKMNEYNIAGAATMAQWAGITALRDGEPLIAETVEHYRQGRDLVFQRLSAMPRVTWPLPEAAFYAYFKVSRSTASSTAWPWPRSWCSSTASGSRRAAPSANRARAICASASPARPRPCRRPWTDWNAA